MHRRTAFTLIELLVVIAIVALLIGILLPALGSARKAARGTANLSNLRQLGIAMELYGGDFECFPPFRLNPGQVHPTTGRPRARWQWFLSDYLGKPPFEPRNDAEYQAFLTNDDLERLDNPVFMDPSQRLDQFTGTSGKVQIERNGSYGYNYHYLGNNRLVNGEMTNFPVRSARVQMRARTISLGDSLGNQTTYAASGTREHSYTMDPPRLDTPRNGAIAFAQSSGKSPAEIRHSRKAMIAFLDGHAQPLTLRQLGYIVVDERNNIVEHDRGDNSLWNGLGSDRWATE